MNSFGQGPPKLGSVLVNSDIGSDIIKSLGDRGATIVLKTRPWEAPVMIRIDPETGLIEAAGEGKARRAAWRRVLDSEKPDEVLMSKMKERLRLGRGLRAR